MPIAPLCALLLAAVPSALQTPELLVDVETSGMPLDGYGPTSAAAGQVVRGGEVILAAWTPETGRELYVAEPGQPARLVADLLPGPVGARPELGALVGGLVYFSADDGQSGRELWRSDGTPGGTQRVHDLAPGPASADVAEITPFKGGVAFIASTSPTDREVWWSDGTPSGLVRLSDLSQGGFESSISALHVSLGTLFFAATDNLTGLEVYATDGTPSSAVMLADMAAGIKNAEPDGYFAYKGLTYIKILSVGSQDAELWVTDGTPAGTQFVRLLGPAFLPPGWEIGEMVEVDGKLVFTAMTDPEGAEIWMTDGTPAGTAVLTDFNPPGFWAPPIGLQVLGSEVLFTLAGDSPGGEPELWKVRAQVGSAQLVADLNPLGASLPQDFTLHAGRVFFSADTGPSLFGRELWSTDGTTAGTVLEGDLAPGTQGSEPAALTATNKGLIFAAEAPGVGRELFEWRAGQPGLNTDLASGAATGDSGPHALSRVFASDLYWAADDGSVGVEPYVAQNGKAPQLLADINPFASSLPDDFTGVVRGGGEVVFFTANDGTRGRELWRTNASGTAIFADLMPGPGGSDPSELIAMGSELFFVARGPSGGRELWRTLGTNAMQLTQNPLIGGSQPDSLRVIGRTLYFTALDVGGVRDVYRTDGNGQVQRITSNTLPLRPVGLAVVAGKLAFLNPLNAAGEVELVIVDPLGGGVTSIVGPAPVRVDWNDVADPGFRPAVREQRYTFFGEHATLNAAVISADVDAGTLTAHFAPDAGSPFPTFGVVRELTWTADALYFAGGGVLGDELYRATTAALSGQLLFDATQFGPTRPTNLTAVGDDLIFSVGFADAPGLVGDLLRTNGGPPEAALELTSVANGGNGGALPGDPAELTLVGSDLYLAATLASGPGREVYRLSQPGAVVVDFAGDAASGSAGQLTLSAPKLGRQLRLRFDNLHPMTAGLVLFSGLPSAPLVGLTAPGDPLWIAPGTAQLGPLSLMGDMQLDLSVSGNPALAGTQFAVQILTVTDKLFGRTSNAVLVTLGG